MVGLTLVGGGVDDPPPENSRVKLASKNFLGQKELGPKKFLSKKTGRVNPRVRIYDSHSPENSRVKILLGCFYYGWVMLHNKFQTSRTIPSGRIRVPVGGGGGGVK